ncbi:MAG: dicarboxylate/amino acid:cation symporter [Sulfolobales archaeon]|nr:dicarboxylate/amino acid:cation symporter [Sulfolobales archaeon]
MGYTAIAFLLGLLVGFTLLASPAAVRDSVLPWLRALGDIFIRLMRLLIPLVIFFTISASISYMRDLVKLGKLLVSTLAVFYSLAFIAIVTGVLAMFIIKPGVGVKLEIPGVAVPTPVGGYDLLMSLIRPDFVELLTVGGSFSMILISVVVGVAVILLGDDGRVVYNYLKMGMNLVIRVIGIISYYIPVAVFAYTAFIIVSAGPVILTAYAKYVATYTAFVNLHFLGIYSLVLTLSGINPVKAFKAIAKPWLIAFTTRSSAVTLPYTMEAARKMGLSDEIVNVVVPLGVTIHMDGSAMLHAMDTLFVAQLFGVELAPYQVALVLLLPLITSTATAPVPGGGLALRGFLFSSVGVPLEGIPIITVPMPIHDPLSTYVNACGDAIASAAVSKISGYKVKST